MKQKRNFCFVGSESESGRKQRPRAHSNKKIPQYNSNNLCLFYKAKPHEHGLTPFFSSFLGVTHRF